MIAGKFPSPILVLLKDCGEVRRYESVQDMQEAFEPIDVENSEYEAWDSEWVPLTLSVKNGTDWLLAERAGPPAPERVAAAITEFARIENVDVDSSALRAGDLSHALEEVAAAVRKKRQAEGWWQKTKRRF